MNFKAIIFIGPQGSGKGTQANLLAKQLGYFYWEMGGILRETAKNSSTLGIEVKKMIDNGILLPDDLLYEVVENKLQQISGQNVIFDGIPRRLAQAEFLINYLKQNNITNITTLFVSLPREESLSRLLKRAEIEKRADDTKEKIEVRLKQYETETVPVLTFLKANSNFFEINGNQPIKKVSEDINKMLTLSDTSS